jgi:serine/threonine-protein kinase PpkA
MDAASRPPTEFFNLSPTPGMTPPTLKLLLLLTLTATAVQADQWTLNDKLVAVDGNPSIPLRLITKPGAKIHKERNLKPDQLLSSPAAFSVLYVSQNKSGNTKVYHAAHESGEPLGFIEESQVLEWKSSLCLRFGNPNERRPVLMFKDSSTLTSLATRDPAQRASLVKGWYSTIDGLGGAAVVPDEFPVLSMEPKRSVNMQRNFYLMPVLEHVELLFGEDSGLGVKVSIASKTGARGSTDLSNKNYVEGTVQEGDLGDASKAAVEIIFCIDLTNSMQPFINASLQVARNVTNTLQGLPGGAQRFRFGLWGYRDEGKEAEGFVVQAFTPQPVSFDQFSSTLAQVKASGKTGGDVPEDMLGGFHQVVQSGFTNQAQSDSEKPIRVIVLIGDAPGHDSPSDPRNSSRQSIFQLRQEATNKGIYVYALHILDPRYQTFHGTAQAQFSQLARNEGTGQAIGGQGTYKPIHINESVDSMNEFAGAAKSLYDGLSSLVGAAGDPKLQDELRRKREAEESSMSEAERQSKNEADVLVNDMFRAAIVDWIARNSKDVTAPNDITAWICDHDLIEPQRASISTCVLLSRNELDHLKQALNIVIEAGQEGQATGKEFFACIQNVAATASVLPGQLGSMKEMKTLGDLKLLPGFLKGLPYKSKLLNMTNEDWSSMPPTRQQKVLDDLQGLIEAYKSIYADTEQWISLTESKSLDDALTVAAVPLTLLP